MLKTSVGIGKTSILAIFLLVSGVLTAQSVSADDSTTIATRMFQWWNHAMENPAELTQESFERYFAKDAFIAINGRVRVSGTDNMVEHFKRIQKKMDAIQIELPFIEEFQVGDRIFTYHRSLTVVDGKSGASLVMGYITTKNQKIASVNFLRVASE